MLPLGRTRYIDFRLVNLSSQPVVGKVLADFEVVFRRDNAACTDALTLKDYGDGRYTVSYVPTTPGHDYLELYEATDDVRVLDTEDIVPADFAIGGGAEHVLDQDFGGTDALRITEADPASYKLEVFFSADWNLGNREDADAIGMTDLDANGRWVSGIRVPAGVYHVVVRRFREWKVVAANLSVG